MNRWLQAYREGRYEYNELVDLLSDYHKDVFGSRLRMWGKPADVICFELDRIDQYMAAMESTPEGREQLRQQGWHIEEPVEDPRQYAEDSADQDAIYYGA